MYWSIRIWLLIIGSDIHIQNVSNHHNHDVFQLLMECFD